MLNANAIILILSTALNWLFAWQLNNIFADDFSYTGIFWTLVIFILWGTALMINLIVVKNRWFQNITFALGATGFFINGFNIFIIASIIFLFIAFIYTRKYIQNDLNNQIKIKSYNVLYLNVWLLIMAVFLVVSVSYYGAIPQLDANQINFIIPPKIFDRAFSITKIIFKNLNNTGLSVVDINILTESLKEQTRTAINNYTANLVISYGAYIPGGLAIGLFLSLQILSWPLRYLLSLLGNLILNALIFFDAVKKKTITIEKEILM